MKDRYDGNRGKENMIANKRHSRLEAEHSAKDMFVKKVQAAQAMHQGKPPMLKDASMHFNAYMCNNGENAQMFAKKLTADIDHVAFPVDGTGDDS